MGDEILIVDDDETLRQLLTHRLESAGYTVRVCEDGQAAADLLDTEYEPALAICDVMMPRLDGTRLVRMIRGGELAVRSDLPIVMLTSRGQEEHVLEGFDSGADDYVTKPFRAQELLARVRRYATA
ncbi:response regulator transcription factor [Haloarcula argentinensis]|uniref:Response regulator n=1 Tax=Haloarcula argentinensis TaxID=43776 RepID=A0ABU2F3X7_HALAR|nr:response regulator [Haloarcula argentinensis]EMA26427.1 response regulator receiver protein [Haloarcula argentinensis DSM 12282]MDS0255269.1 response regulator [Haloarcula argentinensis]